MLRGHCGVLVVAQSLPTAVRAPSDRLPAVPRPRALVNLVIISTALAHVDLFSPIYRPMKDVGIFLFLVIHL